MRYDIKYDKPHRIRLRCGKWLFTAEQARAVEAQLLHVPGVGCAVVHEDNGSVLVEYASLDTRQRVLAEVDGLDPLALPENDDRDGLDMSAIDNEYQMKLLKAVAGKVFRTLLLPPPLRIAWTVWKSLGYLGSGIKALFQGKLSVEVLDATAIGVSLLRGSFSTAGDVMFLLHISDILMEYTQARTRVALRRNLSLFAEHVWLVEGDTETEIDSSQIREGDLLKVYMGSLIPVDGEVVAGEASVNEASMTGESIAIGKHPGSRVYAATVVESGIIVIRATASAGASRIDDIVGMVEDSSAAKASAQSAAERLADGMVPVSLLTFLLVLLFTRDMVKATSVLMVDYSCAIKLTTPIAVMSAMREATRHDVLVKGGKYLEALAAVDTIVFDKTGTLTTAQPAVEKIVSFDGRYAPDELLRIAACMEEHFPHSMARAIVRSAEMRDLHHPEEMHSRVEYIVSHGIASTIDGVEVRIGSSHFIFEDEGVPRPEGMAERLRREAPDASVVYMSMDGALAAAICISDPLRSESAEVIRRLRKAGFGRIVMLTGDSESAAHAVAEKLGLDGYYSQVLPEDKAGYVKEMQAKGHKVAMVGDGINDSPALAAADVSVAMSDASDIARAVADISIMDASLDNLLYARELASRLMDRIHTSYRIIVTLNTFYIVLGVAGVLQPTMSAILHNGTTVALTAANTRNLVDVDHMPKCLQPASADEPADPAKQKGSLPCASGGGQHDA